MSNYEAKQAAKKAFYAEKAKELKAEAEQLYQYDRKQMDLIPFGQPILVGHHSESRHRNALKRSCQRKNKMIELQNKAEYYERKATAKHSAISSDDENAISKLEIKLVKREAQQESMKRINVEYRKGGVDAITGITEEDKAYLKVRIIKDHYSDKKPYPNFCLANNNAEIRRLKKRIAELKAKSQEAPHEAIRGNGYMVTENPEDNRIWIEFDEKPQTNICHVLKSRGFKWSPGRKAWVRMLNQAGRLNAERAIEAIEPLLNEAKNA